MSEATKEIVLNTSCSLCMDANERQKFAPRPSSGHVVHPTLFTQFDALEILKSGWVLHLFFHGRYDQTRVYRMVLRLGPVVRIRDRLVFRLDHILHADVELDPNSTNDRYVLGTVSKPDTCVLHAPTSIRTNEFLVFGDKQGLVSRHVEIPVAHIVAEYYTENP